ncbi:MAG TPA: replicative DNA helicase [Thermotogota bacterium]|nr:replicative DNA helicase [Thermotogota bacterium]HRW91464.1 replicative DNA helicase [Thermotogota bacterium]
MAEPSTPAKIPPHDLEAEKAVLGSMLMDTEVVGDVMEILRHQDFFSPGHQRVFRAMELLFEMGDGIDVLTVSDVLKKRAEIDQAGGELGIARLADVVPTSAHAVQYARVVREKSILRNLIHAGSRIVENAHSQKEVDDILDEAERLILRIGERTLDRSYFPLDKVVHRAFDKLEQIKVRHNAPEGKLLVTGLATGYPDLDEITTGFHPSDMVIVAARPSMGKSALALHLARNMAVDFHYKVGIFSLEMSAEQIALRLLSLESRVPFEKIRRADISNDDWNRLTHAATTLMHTPMVIDDDSMLDPRVLRTKARRIKKEYGLDVIVLDYLQLMNSGRNRENRQQEISEISRSLKVLAREMDVVMIAASQLSRSVEQREDKRPRLSDLRESGAIEQDADTVLFIHREAYYQRAKESSEDSGVRVINEPHEAEIIIGKQRNGPVGSISLTFHPSFVGFFPRSFRNEA